MSAARRCGWAVGALAAVGLGGCLDRRASTESAAGERVAVEPTATPPEGTPTKPNETPEPEARPEPEPPAKPEPPAEPKPEAPRLDDTREHTVIVSPWLVEEVAVLPSGVAFAQGGEIWTVAANGTDLRKRATVIDPHGVVTDGESLYWLGHERNGQLHLGTDKTKGLPRVASTGLQQSLAFGDVLYGRSVAGEVMRFVGGGLSRVSLGAKPQWRALPGFGAGHRVVVLPMMERGPAGTSTFLWRVRVGGKGSKIVTDTARSPRRWSMNNKGSVLFVDTHGSVMRQDLQSRAPRRLFDEAGVTALCWCGAHVCTFLADADEARVHRRGAAEAEVLARGLGDLRRARCNAQRVAWATADDDRLSELHIAPID